MNCSRTGISWLLMLGLVGCSASAPARLFLLTPPQQVAAASATQVDSTPIFIQLRHVTVPDYLDVDSILVRDDRHQVKALPGARWAERLSTGITRALAAMLTAQMPDDAILPTRPVDKRALQILIDVDALDLWRDGRCVLRATWSIVEPGTDKVLRTGRWESGGDAANTNAMPDADAVVTSTAAALEDLAAELVRAVREIQRVSPVARGVPDRERP